MKPPTLLDAVYRASFRRELNNGWRSNALMRETLESARRFVIDEPMARFMAELSNEAFLKVGPTNPMAVRIVDSLRVSARLPHDSIWIEYPLLAYQLRSHEMRGTMQPDIDEVPEREGWLIQQHPKIDSAHIMHLFTQNDKEIDGHSMWTFPVAFGWCSDDSPLPWLTTVITPAGDEITDRYAHPSSFLVGLGAYARRNVGCVRSHLIVDPLREHHVAYRYLFKEWTGILRRVWALLATLADLPVIKGEVRQAKGFLARGQIRKYLSHHTITLNVPARKDTRVLARKMIAVAHRKRHEVKAFWRDDFRHPPSPQCNPHLWEFRGDADHIECSECHGRQTLVHKHMRGDASLGLIVHDYAVTHKETAP